MTSPYESPSRIEPCDLETIPAELADVIADLVKAGTGLGARLNARTAANLADLVSMMNCYYSNLIEGHRTRPRDIERALANDLDEGHRRDLQLEARAHVRVQRDIDRAFAEGGLNEPASHAFLKGLHESFYSGAPRSLLLVKGDGGRAFEMTPGAFRSGQEQDVAVGRHIPPGSDFVPAFMEHFEWRFQMKPMGTSKRIVAMAVAHHRFNYIHPFPDGNGRVSRLMSHAMALHAGIGAHGLWSISRGLARGLEGRGEYKNMMDLADTPRAHDTDGRGNLSAQALLEFVTWFIKVARDQVDFMAGLFDFDRLRIRLRDYVLGPLDMTEEAAALVDETFLRGSIARGEASRITRRPERTARGLLSALVKVGLLASDTPKGDVYLRFSSDSADFLFPRLIDHA
jgi:Fic family protein